MTLSAALQRYAGAVSRHKKGASQEFYRIEGLRRHALAHKLLHHITSQDIARYRDERLATVSPRTGRPLAANSVRLELALLSDVFNVARIEWATCRDNPVTLVRKPRLPPGRTRRLSTTERRRLMAEAKNYPNPACHHIIQLALETAMRQGEILALRWEHIDLRRGIAHLPVTKNGECRDVPLSAQARAALTAVGERPDGAVFGYGRHGFNSAWQKVLKRAGITGLHFHDLRHEALSRLAEGRRLDILELSAISGHKTLTMLKRYVHLKAEDLVKKLDKRSPKRQGLRVFVPYPALARRCDTGVRLTFPDFPTLECVGQTLSAVLRQAGTRLLRHLAMLLQSGRAIPPPGDPVSSGALFVSPLAPGT
ncbi:tyrosine-type recombinase/integrase [Serratia fonticola]|nr:site-specific integrase [Serratia fonticola]NCG54492.1 tyrosine-type recombinase/integrase [Serratia fonticola]